MVAAKRTSHIYPSGWKLIQSHLQGIPDHHQRIADVMIDYMNSTYHHEIWELENEVMNKFEEEKVMCRLEIGVNFKWKVIAKQHRHPFAERYCFAIYSYGNILLAAVFEPPEFGGMVVQKGSYEAK